MNIAIIGSNGLIGSALTETCKELSVNYIPLLHKDFDITLQSDFPKLIEYKVDIVVNTAALLGVERCETEPEKAFLVNSHAVGNLSKFCNLNNIIFAHISTDGVFDGTDGSYNEYSIPNPINIYGVTKYCGEIMIKNNCKRYYIFRIPIQFGIKKNNGSTFIEKMYASYLSGKNELSISDDIINRPSYSKDAAQEIMRVIVKKNDFGIYHIYNGGHWASLYDFATVFFEEMGINDVLLHRVKSSEFARNEIGERPLNATLTTAKLAPLRDWREAIKDYVRELNKNRFI